MSNIKNLRGIGENSLRKNYSALYEFYRHVWAQPHEYIVLNARRCFNLNYLFLKLHEANGGQAANKERIISNNALPLYAGHFAECYMKYKRFPSLLIVDDSVLHGRGISRLLSELEELIVSKLTDTPEEMSREERYHIRRRLASALDIFVFAANKQPLLIEDIYLQKLWSYQRLYPRELRVLSQQISIFLQRAGVPNTSYVLSCRAAVPMTPSPTANWLSRSWDYRGMKQTMYFWNDTSRDEIRFLPTVRYRAVPALESDSDFWLTGLTLFGELTPDQLSVICRHMSEALAKEPFPFRWVRFILRQEHPLLQKQRAQLISFVLSAYCLRHFLEDGIGSDGLFRNSDLDKTAQNFGKTGDAASELNQLLGAPVLQELHGILEDWLSRLSKPFLWEALDCTSGTSPVRQVNGRLEDMFYNIGMSSERSAYRALASHRHQRDNRYAGEISLEDVLGWREPKLGFQFSYSHQPPQAIEKVCCILALMDNGLMAMHQGYREQNGQGVVQCFLKAGELSTFSIPRRLHLFIPALALVERDCWRVEMDSLNAVKQFIRTLPDKATGEPEGRKKEEAALTFLKTQAGDFLNLLYNCGQTLNSWDIDLVTSDDWQEEGEEDSYLSFVIREYAGREYYLSQARSFLNRV